MALNLIEVLEKIAIAIETKKGVPLGSGTLIKIEGDFYIITATHCVFDEKQNEFNTDTVVIHNQEYGEFTLEKAVVQKPFIDAILLRVIKEKEFINYPEIHYTSDYLFPSLEFCFRGKAKSRSGKLYTVYNCSINGKDEQDLINVSIPPEFYTNHKGETGAEVLDGFSGSGLIIQNHKRLYYCGMVCSVSDDNFCGVDCISISTIADNNIIDFPLLKDLPDTSEIVEFDVKNLRKEITKEIIKSAEDSDNIAVKNLKRKMDLFLPDWDQDDLESFVSDMLTWDVLYKEKVKGNPIFKDLIDESKDVLSAGSKKYVVESSREGNRYFHDVKKEFKDIVASFLDEHPMWKRYISTVSNGEIAKYLANCNLDFKE
ncbi:hypothetical protein [Colwellia sp. UCD-KL20]|uniref:hypothetical protein n=1 Tax=Colwellia sp. UCD-KL20 TaxID=1917165 RepID=UPI0009710C9A|nr:hypothetical protein [Colwellia sp. UCD-KL20]